MQLVVQKTDAPALFFKPEVDDDGDIVLDLTDGTNYVCIGWIYSTGKLGLCKLDKTEKDKCKEWGIKVEGNYVEVVK